MASRTSSPMRSHHRISSWLLLIFANVLWASSYVATLFIQPLLGTLLAVLLLQEQLSIFTLFGGVLIIGSVIIISW